MNEAKFEKLPADQKKLLIEATAELQAWKVKYDRESDNAALETLKSKGMAANQLTPEQMAKFVAISKQLNTTFAGLVKDDEFYKNTLKFVGKDK
jgi:TRAP-type C4-dicarboxylate transport system substrate-binding protein